MFLVVVCTVAILMFFPLFSLKKERQVIEKPGFCEYNAVFCGAHAAVDEQHAHTNAATVEHTLPPHQVATLCVGRVYV